MLVIYYALNDFIYHKRSSIMSSIGTWTPKVGKPGPKNFEPTDAQREQVSLMVAFGIPQDKIASSLRMSQPTLHRYFRHELDNGAAIANTTVANSLYLKAIGNGPMAVPAAIFWLKTRARWKEARATDVQQHEITGPDGEPIAMQIEVKLVGPDPANEAEIIEGEFEQIEEGK